jgi:hypothetical protein
MVEVADVVEVVQGKVVVDDVVEVVEGVVVVDEVVDDALVEVVEVEVVVDVGVEVVQGEVVVDDEVVVEAGSVVVVVDGLDVVVEEPVVSLPVAASAAATGMSPAVVRAMIPAPRTASRHSRRLTTSSLRPRLQLCPGIPRNPFPVGRTFKRATRRQEVNSSRTRDGGRRQSDRSSTFRHRRVTKTRVLFVRVPSGSAHQAAAMGVGALHTEALGAALAGREARPSGRDEVGGANRPGQIPELGGEQRRGLLGHSQIRCHRFFDSADERCSQAVAEATTDDDRFEVEEVLRVGEGDPERLDGVVDQLDRQPVTLFDGVGDD